MNATKSDIKPPTTRTLIAICVISLILQYVPLINFLTTPLDSMVTLIHELGHILSCILTGGSVRGMTIVPDGAGHAGVSWCVGGIRFIVSQAGYLSTTLVGCVLIVLARKPGIAKVTLFTLGVLFGIGSFVFTFMTLVQGNRLQGLGSMFMGLVLAASFIQVSQQLNAKLAHIFLLFVGVDLTMASLSDVCYVLGSAFGVAGTGSDATNMETMTGVPAAFWAFMWCVFSVAMVMLTIRFAYKPSFNIR